MAVIEVARIRKGLRNVKERHKFQWMPHPTGAEQSRPTGVRCQARMEKVRRLAVRRFGKQSTGFGVLQVDAAIVSRAVREQDAAVGTVEQGNGIFVRFRMVEAAIKLAKNLSVPKQKPLRSQPFIDHGKAPIRRCRRGVEPVAVAHAPWSLRAIGCERTAAADPIDEFVAAPAE